MRRLASSLALLLGCFAAPLAAQDHPPRPLTAEAARRVVSFYDDPATLRFNGGSRVPAGSTIRGNVAALDGDLVIDGRVEGDVVVINGDATVAPGGEVTGRLTVAGGVAHLGAGARVGGEVAAFADRIDYLRRGDAIFAEVGGRLVPDPAEIRVAATSDAVRDADRPWSEPDSAAARERTRARGSDANVGDEDEGWSVHHAAVGQGRADFIVATGQSYNRVEGLPITVGPALETAGRNPLRLRAMGIFRTESGPELGPERWGYDARLEQFFGGRREFRVGGTLYRRIDPIEDWHLSKLENGLSTFFLHRDFRDHFERQGASAYLAVTPERSPFEAMLEMRGETERAEPAGSPFSLFDNTEAWRPQPLAAHGRLESLVLSGKVDTRSTARDPASGWFVRAEVEEGIHSRLRQPSYLLTTDPEPATVYPGAIYGSFTSGLLDVRRYNRIGPWSRLNLRAIAGGSLDGSPMPPQRQHALGGEGSLPGFPLFSLDCGARNFRVYRYGDVIAQPATPGRAPDEYFPQYGCDRFALFQAEYRGDLRFHLHWGGDDDDAGGEGWARAALRNGLSSTFSWVLFADAGRGWSVDGRDGTGPATDVGAGVIVGRLGVYGAVPVSTGGRFNLFVRLSPRI